MHMAVDKAGAEVSAVCIDFFPTGIGAYTQDDAVAHGDIAFLDGARKHIDYVRVFDDQGGVPCGGVEDCIA
jgi:hypothetical protein